MSHDAILFAIFLIFTGAALLGGVALIARQSLLVAYIVLGVLFGPSGIGVVEDLETIANIGHVGIIFLLFLLGLNLHPQKLLRMLREATKVTVLSSLVFAAVGALIALVFGFRGMELFLVAALMMFSSTILGLKLLPTTALHHRRMGEIIISVLLLQDIIAIVMLLVLEAYARPDLPVAQMVVLFLSLPALAVFAYVVERFVLDPLIQRFDTIHEYVFLVAIGWCIGLAQLAHVLGLSHEMGAFIAGVALATSRISTYIAESLKPLRDFFLIMFFFALGATFKLSTLADIAIPALLLASVMLVLKPLVFRVLLVREGESPKLAHEIGFRLGQISEFSLLIVVLAAEVEIVGTRASYLIEAATVLAFIASSYLIMLRFPTPIAVSDRLRRD